MILVVLDNQYLTNEVTKICNEPGKYQNVFHFGSNLQQKVPDPDPDWATFLGDLSHSEKLSETKPPLVKGEKNNDI